MSHLFRGGRGGQVFFLVFALIALFSLRNLIFCLVSCRWPDSGLLGGLVFPSWEGPFFLGSVFGFGKASVDLMYCGCFHYQILGGAISLFVVVFMLIGTYRIRSMWQKKMVFAASEKVTLWRLLREPWKQSGFWAKIASFRTLYTLKRFRGDWEMDERYHGAAAWSNIAWR
ncbi:hypothetical protein T484DRAFT_1760872 [Baffinella frigidus]|nr:hypothetical protein T484DRAFT_1760872 [Cryptophyta sp. CCMP2293]